MSFQEGATAGAWISRPGTGRVSTGGTARILAPGLPVGACQRRGYDQRYEYEGACYIEGLPVTRHVGEKRHRDYQDVQAVERQYVVGFLAFYSGPLVKYLGSVDVVSPGQRKPCTNKAGMDN